MMVEETGKPCEAGSSWIKSFDPDRLTDEPWAAVWKSPTPPGEPARIALVSLTEAGLDVEDPSL